MPDWEDALTPEQKAEWDAYVKYTREETVRSMDGSAMVCAMAPSDGPDVKFAMEIGLSIMLDKPILILAQTGQKIPPKLRAVADEVLFADVDTEEGQRVLAEGVKKFHAKFVGSEEG